MRYNLISVNGKKIASTLSAAESALLATISSESTLVLNNKARAGRLSTEEGTIFAYSDEPDFLHSSQKFKTLARTILNSIKYISETVSEQIDSNNRNTKRLIHNLTSLNAHNIQEIYALLSQDELSGKMNGHVEYAKKIIEGNTLEAAKSLLRIAKNNASMKTEISVFNKLFIATSDLRPYVHTMHKVLMNVLYLFFPDFTDKSVDVTVQHSEASAYFDYESIHVALYHIIDNAAKYTIPNTKLIIGISQDVKYLDIIFRMCSTKILEKEREKIYDEDFSGSIALLTGKAGSGIGMSLVKRIVESNNGSILLKTVDGTDGKSFGIDFQTNEFILKLPRSRNSHIPVTR